MSSFDGDYVPWSLIDDRLATSLDTSQHKAFQANKSRKRSIRFYRHATTKWGAALEGFKPMWVCWQKKSQLSPVVQVCSSSRPGR